MTTQLACPVCSNSLEKINNSLICKNRHCFDFAKSGYVNLLLANKTNSKIPGDNKLMVTKRHDFLIQGYYSTLLKAVCRQVVEEASKITSRVMMVDVGCGEGYYTSGMYDSFQSAEILADIVGIDISKFAAELASKQVKQQNRNIIYAVASAFRLPFGDNTCDILTELFAPYNGDEFRRVLKPNGKMIIVIPAQNHLFELKSAVYSQPYKNEVKPYELDGFELISRHQVTDIISLRTNEDIQNLFTMTPYYYKTSIEDTKKLEALNQLDTTIDFEILSYKAVN